MRLIGKNKIQPLLNTDTCFQTWCRAWVAELINANWNNPFDVSSQFPNVRQLNSEYFIFPIDNSNKEIHLKIAFQQGIAMITDIQ